MPATTGVASGRVARWVLLAFVPSSLLLGATQFITSEIAAIPLLWAVPLAIYLLTWVVAFGRGDRVPLAWISWALAVLATTAALLGTLKIKPEVTVEVRLPK